MLPIDVHVLALDGGTLAKGTFFIASDSDPIRPRIRGDLQLDEFVELPGDCLLRRAGSMESWAVSVTPHPVDPSRYFVRSTSAPNFLRGS